MQVLHAHTYLCLYSYTYICTIVLEEVKKLMGSIDMAPEPLEEWESWVVGKMHINTHVQNPQK